MTSSSLAGISEPEAVEPHEVFDCSENLNDLSPLLSETLNFAILDSACSSTVCVEAWFDCFSESMHSDELIRVKDFNGDRILKFGSVLKSIKRVEIPCFILDKQYTVSIDIVKSETPLLLGKPTMRSENEIGPRI